MEVLREHRLKIILLAVYIGCIIGVYGLLSFYGVDVDELLMASRAWIESIGAWSWLAFLGIYAASTFIPFPTTSIAIIGGVLFGPIVGSILSVIGTQLTAGMSFALSRYLGRHLVAEREKGWVKSIDELLSEKGFFPVMIMRLVFVPSDFVSLGSGLTKMPYKTFLFATLFGTAPATVLFAYFGDALFDSVGRFAIGLVVVALIVAILLLRRIPWIHRHLPKI